MKNEVSILYWCPAKNPSNNENLFDINYIDNNMFRTQRYRSPVKLSVFQKIMMYNRKLFDIHVVSLHVVARHQ